MSSGDDSERTRDDSPGGGTGASGAAGPTGKPSDLPRPVPGAGTSGAPSGTALVFDDPLDRLSADDTDRGWGDSAPGSVDDDFTRFLNEKPPHHL